jgi:hypothetical protein
MYTSRLRTAEDVCIWAQALDPNSPAASNFNWRGKLSTPYPIARLPGNRGLRAKLRPKKKLVPNSSQTGTPNLPNLTSTKSVMMRSGVPSTMSDFVRVRLPGTVCLREAGFLSIRTQGVEPRPWLPTNVGPKIEVVYSNHVRFIGYLARSLNIELGGMSRLAARSNMESQVLIFEPSCFQ